MNIVIYNTNSFGGNYEYSKSLADAYLKRKEIESCIVVIPENQNKDNHSFFRTISIPDISGFKNKLLKKIYYLYRSIVNPLRFYSFLKSYHGSVVIFNDYDQLTSLIWVSFFKKLKKKHTFAVILHDANRDMFMPTIGLSNYTMNQVMSIMDVAFFHEVLPDKVYYKNSVIKINVPHGIYSHFTHDAQLYQQLITQKGNHKIVSILGNIRDEKNYNMIIEALANTTDTMLLIAGHASSSDVRISDYKANITRLGLENRVIWVNKFLTDDEFQSAIMASDVILLYYKEGFTSQSGVLNLIATHKKNLIVSDVPSALRETVTQFKIGKIVPLNVKSLVAVLNDISNDPDYSAWDNYINYASWDNHVDIAINSFKMQH